MGTQEKESLKLWPTTLNRDEFRKIITAGSTAEVISRFPLVRLPGKGRRKAKWRGNLIEAYLYFASNIKSWVESAAGKFKKSQEDAASILLEALCDNFWVVRINVSESDDAQEIFYSLNSQGKALKQSDLLRSLIFIRVEKERKYSNEAIFDEFWKKFETDFWNENFKRGGRDSSHLDLALRHFLTAKTGKMVDTRRVIEDYRRWLSDETNRYLSVKDELTDFTRYAEGYRRYEDNIGQLPSTDFRRVVKDFDVSTVLPLVLFLELDGNLDEEQQNICLSMVESFIARRVLTGEETKDYNRFFVEAVGVLRGLEGATLVSSLQTKLLSGSGRTRHWPTDEDVIEKIISRPVYKAWSVDNIPSKFISLRALKLILERLELHYRSKKSEDMEIAPELQIEHVMPQKWGSFWPLQGVIIPTNLVDYPHRAENEFVGFVKDIKSRNAAVHTLGNLTLLNKYLNPAASNGPFELKLKQYQNSVLRLNRYFDQQSSWDVDSIAHRGQLLGEALCRIWPRPEDAS